MNLKNLIKSGLGLLCLGFLFSSCGGDTPNAQQLDKYKSSVIKQYVEGVVAPTYRSLADNAMSLAEICQELKKAPTQELVNKACQKWVDARIYWERSEAFLFGAAGDYNIDPHIDSWPLQKSQLDKVLANQELIDEMNEEGPDATGFSSLGHGLLGFHAVEYVIFRNGKARPVAEITKNETQAAVDACNDLLEKIDKAISEVQK